MKKYNSFVKKYIKNKKRHKRQLAALVSMSLMVSVAVPMILIEPAVSMTKVNINDTSIITRQLINETNASTPNAVSNMNGGETANSNYSKGHLTEAELLIGNGRPDHVDEGIGTDADSAINAMKNKYLLGIAADFCVFLENDFKPATSDCEGRVAVGGSVIIITDDYQIGSGDFGNKKVLTDTSNYDGMADFAHIIMGGQIIKNVAPYGTKNEGHDMIFAKGTDAEKEQNAFKRIVVPEDFTISDATATHKNDNGSDKQYNNSCTHWGTAGNGATINESALFYKKQLIKFDEAFEYMRKQSQALEKISGAIDAVVDPVAKTVTFDASSVPRDSKVVYFNLDTTNMGEWGDYTFYFKHIPEIGGTVQSEVSKDKLDEKGSKIDGLNLATSYPKIAHIVINTKGDDIRIGGDSKIVYTYINDHYISNVGNKIDEENQYWSNNHPYSENLLYNFVDYNEDDGVGKPMFIGANFNGTILAPNAVATSKKDESDYSCPGHLSGALIAKSFEGGLEFGYRPYNGTIDILSSTSGYDIPIKKVIGNTPTGLEGATFEIRNQTADKSIGTFKSGEGGNKYVNIPTAIQFDGKVAYTINQPVNTEYRIKEISAPKGFIKDDDKEFKIVVSENIKTFETRVEFDNPVPTQIETTIKIYSQQDDSTEFKSTADSTLTFTYTDEYDPYSNKLARRIVNIGSDKYVMEIDNGSITNVGTWDGVTKDTVRVEYTYRPDVEVWKKTGDSIVDVKDSSNNQLYQRNKVSSSASSQEVPCKDIQLGFGNYSESSKRINEFVIYYSGNKEPKHYTEFDYPYEANNNDRWKFDFCKILNITDNNDKENIVGFKIVLANSEDLSGIVANGWSINGNEWVNDVWSGTVEGSSDQKTWTIGHVPSEQQEESVTVNSITIEGGPGTVNIFYADGTSKEETISNGTLTLPVVAETPTSAPEEEEEENNEEGNEEEEGNGEGNENSGTQEPEVLISNENIVGIKVTGDYVTSVVVDSSLADDTVYKLFNNSWATAPGTYYDQYLVSQNPTAPPIITPIGTGNTYVWGSGGDGIETGYKWVYSKKTETIPTGYEQKTVKGDPETRTREKEIPRLTNINEIEAKKESGKYTSTAFSSNSLYFDSPNIMIMPLPSTDKIPTFSNELGLIFNKKGMSGGEFVENLSNAVINIYTANDEPVISNVLGGKSPNTIDISSLSKDGTVVYKFVESEEGTPDGYETANPIYFSINGTTVSYGDSASNLNKTFDLNDNNTDTPPSIEMEDIEISGAKLKFEKTDSNFSDALLGGAEFTLYAVDTINVPICEIVMPDSGDNKGKFDLSAYLIEQNINNKYTKDGYLLKGTYILQETTPPSGYAPCSFQFTVNDDNTINFEEVGKQHYQVVSVTGDDNSIINIPSTISGITKIEIYFEGNLKENLVHCWDFTGASTVNTGGISNTSISGNDIDFNIVDNYAEITFSTPTNLGTFKTNAYANSIKEVRIYTNGSGGGSSSGGGGGSSSSGGTINECKIVVQENDTWSALWETSDWSHKITLNQNNNHYEYGNKNGSDGKTINAILLAVGSPDDLKFKVAKLKFYYAGGGTEESSDITISSRNSDDEWKSEISIPSNWSKGNIVAVEIDLAEKEVQTTTTTTTSSTTTTTTAVAGGDVQKKPNTDDDDYDTWQLANKSSDDLNIGIIKEWSGFDKSEYAEVILPESITVVLLRRPEGSTNENDWDGTWEGATHTITKPEEANGQWKYEWKKLEKQYEYKVQEINVPGFTTQYKNGSEYGNTSPIITSTKNVTVKNTLQTIKSIKAKKIWKDNDNITMFGTERILPDSIDIELYCRPKDNSSAEWKILPSTRATIPRGDNGEWEYIYNNLPAMYEYRIHEISTSNNWTVTGTTVADDTSTTMSITNKYITGDLTIKKNWYNDEEPTDTNTKIKFNIYRSLAPIPPATIKAYNKTMDGTATYDLSQDYSRLLQYSLYFYDANMCGDKVGENSAFSWRNDCHTYSDEVLGGYHDAGDHVMFGLPQGFTASTLGWSYYENSDAYDSLGLTDHYQTIMKRFCDFFVASYDDTKGLLVQKGEGGSDHGYWGSPESQGIDTRKGEIWTKTSGSNIAAQYAAALAQYVIKFGDDENHTYLNKAKALYTFAKTVNSPYSSAGFYEDNECDSELAWAAGWLYLATKDSDYKTDCCSKINGKSISDQRGYFWGDVTVGAMCLYKEIDPSYDASTLESYLNSKCTGTDYLALDTHGSARHNMLLQTTALTYDKITNSNNYKEWCANQTKMILGDNDGNKCLITGYSDNSVENTHHRAASGTSSDSVLFYDADNGKVIIGALSGGPSSTCGQNESNWSYGDVMTDYVKNEVALDYNAGLTAAAAALYTAYENDESVNKNFTLDDITAKGSRLALANANEDLRATVNDAYNSAVHNVLEEAARPAQTPGNPNPKATDFDGIDTMDDATITNAAIPKFTGLGTTFYKTITLDSSNSWSYTEANLPLCDSTGRAYVYYIEEVTENNQAVDNNGRTIGYFPIEYSGNGVNLSTSADKSGNIEVTNKKIETSGVTLPSAGGMGINGHRTIGIMVMLSGCAYGAFTFMRRKKSE